MPEVGGEREAQVLVLISLVFKESLRPKLEAFEAYLNYRQKAKAAGLLIHHHRHGHGMLNLMRKHCKEMHK